MSLLELSSFMASSQVHRFSKFCSDSCAVVYKLRQAELVCSSPVTK